VTDLAREALDLAEELESDLNASTSPLEAETNQTLATLLRRRAAHLNDGSAMPLYKITTPNKSDVSYAGSELDPEQRVWTVFGVAYTRSDAVAARARRQANAGADVQVEVVTKIPDDYKTAVANLEAYGTKHTNPIRDAADPDSIYRRLGHEPGVQWVDVRDIVGGKFNKQR
jgi:hypothetical protein